MASAAASWCSGEGLEDADGERHAMLGLLGHATSFAKRKMNLGYRQATLTRGSAARAERARPCAATNSTMRR